MLDTYQFPIVALGGALWILGLTCSIPLTRAFHLGIEQRRQRYKVAPGHPQEHTYLCPKQAFTLSPLDKRPFKGYQLSAVSADTAPTIGAPLQIVSPTSSFPDTTTGQVSVVSMNVLAPTYHALDQPIDQRMEWSDRDRQSRYPHAIAMAKRKNADILCLQEVEGGQTSLKELLGSLLLQPELDVVGGRSVRGYDGYVWSPLLPNSSNSQDPVGLCVAWRSDRYRLVSCETFRRGMVVQLAELATGATVALANLHLPAKPSAVEGRLRTMASAIRRLQTCDAVVTSSKKKTKTSSALDGLALVVGDFNCDQNAPAAKLLKTGYSLYGTIRDRNYKAKISKKVAGNMKHIFRFKDIYDQIRYDVAPVTVSLNGRGPGCMDHIFYSANGDDDEQRSKVGNSKAASLISASMALRGSGKRQARRERGIRRKTIASTHHPEREMQARVRLVSVLATADETDKGRSEIIEKGLPNAEEGFPSDHLPIGALFESYAIDTSEDLRTATDASNEVIDRRREKINERRGAYENSLLTRRRHNKILRCMAEWLLQFSQVTEMIRDVPLYKWKWITNDLKLNKKMRAPDLCCIVGGAFVIVEVTVVAQNKNMQPIYKEKVDKYQDVLDALTSSNKMQDFGINSVASHTTAVVLDEAGNIYDQSRRDLEHLSRLCDPPSNSGVTCARLCEEFREVLA